MAIHQWDDESELLDRGYLGKIVAARYEAESFLALHAHDYFATPQNGKIMTDFMQKHGLALTAENFEETFEQLKSAGELLPAREAVARMSTAEFKQFAAEHGTPVYDGFGRLAGHNLPDAYSAPTSSEDYNRGRQSSTLTPVRDDFPEDQGKTFSKRQLAGFSADRYRAYMRRTEQWGK